MIFRWSGSTISEVSQDFVFEICPLRKSCKNGFPMVRAKTNLISFLKVDPPGNHEKTTFRAFLETKGPRDPPWMQERQILFRIALTRALYDQTAPQLSSCYVPGKLSFSCLVFIWIFAPFCCLENTSRRKGKLQSVHII